MRAINFLVIHCSASDNPSQDDVSMIRELHTAPKDQPYKWGEYDTRGKAWQDVGYHFFIKKDGSIQKGRDIEKQGAHAQGYNATSIGICLSGSKEFNDVQFKMAALICQALLCKYHLEVKDIIPHNRLNKYKSCPNFNVQDKIISLISTH